MVVVSRIPAVRVPGHAKALGIALSITTSANMLAFSPSLDVRKRSKSPE